MINIYRNFFLHYSSLLIIASLALSGSPGAFSLVLISVFLHECGHLIMMRFVGEKAERLVIHAFGISIDTEQSCFEFRKGLLIALGGPLFSLLLAGVFYFIFPPLFLPNLCLGVINILPVMPLDGGRAVSALLLKTCGRKGCRLIMRYIGFFVGIPAALFGILLFITSGYNFSLLLLGIFTLATTLTHPFSSPPSFVHKKAVLGEIYIVPNSYSPLSIAEFLPADSIGAVVDERGTVLRLVTSKGIYFELANKDNK